MSDRHQRIAVGTKVLIDPLYGVSVVGYNRVPVIVEGTITMVHPTNRWFLVEYGYPHLDRKLHIGFKFTDFGTQRCLLSR